VRKGLLRSQVALELDILKLEGLQAGSVVRGIEESSDDQKGVVCGIADAGEFSVGVELGGELLTYDKLWVNV
jgi:hypothetical protein